VFTTPVGVFVGVKVEVGSVPVKVGEIRVTVPVPLGVGVPFPNTGPDGVEGE
jgi:exosome complex RNA-binding protein Rrp42 (RNase PH superfamily)